MKKTLKSNVLSIRSELGGGLYGCLGLILRAGKYAHITGHTFTPHPNTGHLPMFIENLLSLKND